VKSLIITLLQIYC